MKRATATLLSTLLLCATSAAIAGPTISMKDPTGDDKGPGKYKYPSKALYKRGSFDLTHLTITDKGSKIEIRVGVNAKIGDPWNSKSWGGNGFSLQMVQVYLDTKKGGFRGSLRGMNIKFKKGQGWDKVVFISPQPRSKIISEVKAKSKTKKKIRGLVVPVKTYAQGRELIALVKKSDIGTPKKRWGVQALLQSNEGYPAADSILARKVNEYAGADRFGGGSDYNCDPHVLDIFAGKAKGADSEKAAQYKMLGSYKCNAEGKGKKAVIEMIYPLK
jgi:carbohydrate-binding DOMON domain-containing protein